MNRILVFVCFVMMSLYGFAQLEHHPSVSTSQTGGRYEIIQSPIARILTLKLDKYTGMVYELVESKNQSSCVWYLISNPTLDIRDKYLSENEKNKMKDKICFQLFMGGIALKDCFLLDLIYGDTYKLCRDTDTGQLFFSKVTDYYSNFIPS